MKSLNKYLNEGFFSNTGAGINAAIDQWMKENTKCNNYTINNDGTIDVNDEIDISNIDIIEFPDYIRFGKVKGNFYCVNCKSLTSLKGVPKEVGGGFYCSRCNSLRSLEGAPKEVNGYFNCSYCTSLTSLEGIPKAVGRNFICSHCDSLTSLKGAPEEVGDSF